jgi:hypothetical protein
VVDSRFSVGRGWAFVKHKGISGVSLFNAFPEDVCTFPIFENVAVDLREVQCIESPVHRSSALEAGENWRKDKELP